MSMNHVHEILPNLYLGDFVAAANRPFLQEKKISLIVNATKHIPNYFEESGEYEYIRVPVEDNLDPEEVHQLYLHAIDVIPKIEEAYRQGRPILLHCHAGQQRSAALAVIFLMYHFWPYHSRDAIFYVTTKRPIAFQGGRYVNFQGAIDRYESDMMRRA